MWQHKKCTRPCQPLLVSPPPESMATNLSCTQKRTGGSPCGHSTTLLLCCLLWELRISELFFSDERRDDEGLLVLNSAALLMAAARHPRQNYYLSTSTHGARTTTSCKHAPLLPNTNHPTTTTRTTGAHDAAHEKKTTRERMGAPQHLTINTLPPEAQNLLVVLLLCAYVCWVLRAAVRLYHSWRITKACVPRDRVVLVEELGHRVEVSPGEWAACGMRWRWGGKGMRSIS